MVLMPGVVFVKEGTELKGPPRVEDPNRMSMETYEAMHKMLEAKAIERASPTTVPDEKSVDGSQVASPVGILDQDDAASDAGVDENDMNAPLPEVDVSATKVEKSSADPNIILTQDPSWGSPPTMRGTRQLCCPKTFKQTSGRDSWQGYHDQAPRSTLH